MSGRFDAQPVWDENYEGNDYPPIVGYVIRDQKQEEDVVIEGRRMVFEDSEHAEIFARVMNFGDKLKD